MPALTDELLDEIGDFRFWNDRKARTLAYGLFALSGSNLRDYRMDVQMELGRGDDDYRAAGYVDTRDEATDMLDGVRDDTVRVRHHGSAVRHFGEGIGWTVSSMTRLADVGN